MTLPSPTRTPGRIELSLCIYAVRFRLPVIASREAASQSLLDRLPIRSLEIAEIAKPHNADKLSKPLIPYRLDRFWISQNPLSLHCSG